MKKILVTGCAGFIGSHTCEKLLADNYEVIGIDNFDNFYAKSIKQTNIQDILKHKDFTFFEVDICDAKGLEELPNDIDAVVHLASKAGVRPSIENPDAYINVNIIGTKTILDWMVSKGVDKMAFASSSSVYGNNSKVPFSELDNVDHPISPYAFTKKTCELINYTYHYLFGLNVMNLRLFTVYGPRQRPDLAIRKFLQMIREDKPLTMYGDGSTSRDYTYIDDIVTGISSSLSYIFEHKIVFEVVNLGNGSPIKLYELVELLYQLNNKRPNIKYLPIQEGDVNRTYADISKAQRLLKYAPKVSMTDGLKKFMSWYEKSKFNA